MVNDELTNDLLKIHHLPFITHHSKNKYGFGNL